MKKIISAILILVFLFSLCGCKDAQNTESEAPVAQVEKGYKTTMTLLYSDSDTLNPYDAKTEINRQLCKLLYEPLVKLNNEFEPYYSIASSVKTVKNVCTVKIKDIKFSDGSVLTAQDVVYSYNLAMDSSSSYKYKLYAVDSVKATDSKTVVFKLSKNDPYFVNVLDFPIIKENSDKKTDSDSVKFPPVGSGRYRIDQEKGLLLQNENYHGKKGSIKTINLINAPDNESISHYVEIGAVDMYYSDISDGAILRMSGTKYNINLNNLVYIGINHKDKKLAVNELRQAISSGIDRQKICKDAFYNNAIAATGFFNPVWKQTQSLQNIQITSNLQITVENLEKIGYNEVDNDGLRRKSNSALRFSLLVNKENAARVATAELIKKQLKECGIGITIDKVSYKEYLKRLASGDFDLYLGEVKITENMDFSELVSAGGSAAFGIKAVEEKEDTEKEKTEEVKTSETEDKEKQETELFDCAQVIKGFYKGENSINDVAVTLQNDMPLIPVCYRLGVLFCNENIENVKYSSLSDIYFSIELYKIKVD